MKVVCVNNGPMLICGVNLSKILTLDKVYEALGDNLSPNDSVFNIINDIGNRGSYYFGRFETLEEYRQKKLEKLGV